MNFTHLLSPTTEVYAATALKKRYHSSSDLTSMRNFSYVAQYSPVLLFIHCLAMVKICFSPYNYR